MTNPLSELASLDLDRLRCDRDEKTHHAGYARQEAVQAALVAELAAHDKAQAALVLKSREVDGRVKKLDGDVLHAEGSIRAAKGAQAFEAAQRELERKLAERDAAETEGLELIDVLEASKAKRKAMEEKVARGQAELARAEASRDAALGAIAGQRTDAGVKHAALLAGLEPAIKNKYTELVETLGLPVFTKERDGCCSECGGEMARGVSARVAAGGAFVACTTCGRIVLH